MNARPHIVGVGARTPLGLTAVETGFVMRTGQAAMTTAPLLDKKEQPITFCVQPTLDPRSTGWRRALELAMPAMEEALAPVRPWAQQLRIRLALAIDAHLGAQMSPPDPWGRSVSAAAELVAAMQARSRELAPAVADRNGIAVIARGAAGPASALPEHLDALAAGQIDALLFGGVHTDYDPAVIASLDEQGRLYSPDNLDALIPGESSAFVLLMQGDVARRAGLESWAQIVSLASGFEEANPDNDLSAFEARGLTLAVRTAAKPLTDQQLRVGWMLTDLTFEMRRLYEWQSMLVRMKDVFGDPWAMDSPAQRMGHLGAAAMPLQIALASVAHRRRYAPSPYVLGFAGSDSGERGAVIVSE